MGNLFLIHIENSLYCHCNTCIVSKNDTGSTVETVYGDAFSAVGVSNVLHSHNTSYYSYVKSYSVYMFDPDGISEFGKNLCSRIYCKSCMRFLGWSFMKENTCKFIILKRNLKGT